MSRQQLEDTFLYKGEYKDYLTDVKNTQTIEMVCDIASILATDKSLRNPSKSLSRSVRVLKTLDPISLIGYAADYVKQTRVVELLKANNENVEKIRALKRELKQKESSVSYGLFNSEDSYGLYDIAERKVISETVGPHVRAVKVNAMVTMYGVGIYNYHTEDDIERLWEEHNTNPNLEIRRLRFHVGEKVN